MVDEPEPQDAAELAALAKPDPTKPTDAQSGREPGSWKTRYPHAARQGIYREFWYLAIVFILAAIAFPRLACWSPKNCPCGESMRLYSLATLGGLLGGWMFTARWLINAVVAWRWDEDRHLWRILNPFIAAALALVFFAVIRSGLFQVLNSKSVSTPSASVAVGFLVGYFSDRAIGKLGDIADTLFGTKHGMIDKPMAGKDKDAPEEPVAPGSPTKND
jgi:hypothetical protein